ncbi:MAG: TRAM domain-containing protein [Actinomycetes bacterium]
MGSHEFAPVPVGTLLDVRVGDIAHGGHCVARHEGQVLFVRHGLPGEFVRVRVNSAGGGGRFLRADVVEVLESEDVGRVSAPCEYAKRCGGCDWQHVSLARQRELKAEVVNSALSRALGRSIKVTVEQVPGDSLGLGWRTRIQLAVGADGRAGLSAQRSHEVIPIDDCLLGHPDLQLAKVLSQRWAGSSQVVVDVDGRGGREVSKVPGPRGPDVHRTAAGRDWVVPGAGFWQVHPGAADVLVAAVTEVVTPKTGEHILDLYAGVGLLGGSLAGAVGATGRVDLVESGRAAVRAAGTNLADLSQVRVHYGEVGSWLAQRRIKRADVVVLDPPRSGAGPQILAKCIALAPKVICYVACDPAALARDAKMLAEAGWELFALRAFDLFPMTQHIECVAGFRPVQAPGGSNS